MTDLEMATLVPDPLEEVAPPRGQHGAAAWAVWLARRLGLAVLTLWLVSILVFLATAALGDPVRAILGRDYNSNPGRVAELEEQLSADAEPGLALLRLARRPAHRRPRHVAGQRAARCAS